MRLPLGNIDGEVQNMDGRTAELSLTDGIRLVLALWYTDTATAILLTEGGLVDLCTT